MNVSNLDHSPQTVTHREGTSHEEEAGGSSDEEGSALSPDGNSPGPITPHVISNSQPVVVTPTKQTLESLPEYKGDNRGLDVLKESPNPRPLGQDTKVSHFPHS
jgi:hypothetical protein